MLIKKEEDSVYLHTSSKKTRGGMKNECIQRHDSVLMVIYEALKHTQVLHEHFGTGCRPVLNTVCDTVTMKCLLRKNYRNNSSFRPLLKFALFCIYM